MKRLFKIYLEKPELAGVVLLVLLVILFESTSNGAFLSYENMRGVLGLLPEMGLVAMGVTIVQVIGVVAVLHSHVIPRLFRGQFLNSDFEDLAGRVEGN